MVDAARRLTDQLGVSGVEHRVIDAEQIELPDASVDAVLCRWGYMLVAEPARAFAETRRVLKPGGRVAFAVWARPDENPWASVVGRVLVAHGALPPPDPSAPGMFSMASAGADRAARRRRRASSRSRSRTCRSPSSTPASTSTGRRRSSSAAGSRTRSRASPTPSESKSRRDVERDAAPWRTNGGYALPGPQPQRARRRDLLDRRARPGHGRARRRGADAVLRRRRGRCRGPSPVSAPSRPSPSPTGATGRSASSCSARGARRRTRSRGSSPPTPRRTFARWAWWTPPDGELPTPVRSASGRPGTSCATASPSRRT